MTRSFYRLQFDSTLKLKSFTIRYRNHIRLQNRIGPQPLLFTEVAVNFLINFRYGVSILFEKFNQLLYTIHMIVMRVSDKNSFEITVLIGKEVLDVV